MLLTRVLEKKGVIRAFGMGLVLAPIGNTIAKMSTLNGAYGQWSFNMFWKIIGAGSILNQILYLATIAIGFLMLRGSASVWKWALILLGGYIGLQVSDFKHVRSSGLTWTFFLTNIAVFMFIADQLVFKVDNVKAKKKPAPTPAPKPVATMQAVPAAIPLPEKKAPPTPQQKPAKVIPMQAKAQPKPQYKKIPKVRKKILFQFAGDNPWGQLVSISSKGLLIKGLKAPPEQITDREIDLILSEGLQVRTKFSMKNDDGYFFDYADLTKEKAQQLNRWLGSLQA